MASFMSLLVLMSCWLRFTTPATAPQTRYTAKQRQIVQDAQLCSDADSTEARSSTVILAPNCCEPSSPKRHARQAQQATRQLP